MPSSRPGSSGGKPVSYGFDGYIWIGSRTLPRISIDTSAAVAQIQVANQLVQPSCKALQSAVGPTELITPTIRCDVDLSGFQRNRFQSLTVTLGHSGSHFALDIEPAAEAPTALFLGGTALIAILVFVLVLCRAANQSWIISAICAGGTGVRLFCWAQSPPWARTHDASGHVEYVTLVALNWIRPDRNVGWETHQAPLYYYIGAGVVSLERNFGFNSLGSTLSSLQCLSLVFSILTVFVAFLCFKECAGLFGLAPALRGHAVAMALALYVFWPSGVIDSVRIGNDSLLVLFAVVFFFFILRWHSRKNPHALVAASVAAALAIVTKASGVVLLPVLCLAVTLEWRSQPRRSRYKRLFWVAAVLIFAGLIAFWPAIKERMSGRNTSLLLAQNVAGPEFAVGNRPHNYLLFNPEKFIRHPFTDLFNDQYGRQYFWNSFWKTSLFGESWYPGRFQTLCASVLCALLLLLLSLAFLSICFCDLGKWKPLVSILVFAVAWIGGTIAFSVLHPFSPNHDFRYAAPALICICWLAALSSSRFASKGWFRIAKGADIVLLLFIVSSIGFVLGLTCPRFLNH
jgi:hypothetical protein